MTIRAGRRGQGGYLGILIGLTSACTTPSATLRADAAAYIDQMSSWAPVEAETARAIGRIFATEFVDEAEVLRQVGEALPRAQRHLREAAAYHAATTEVRRIHVTYLEAWRTLVQGLDRIEEGLRLGDQALLATGRQRLIEWREGIVDVARALRALRDRTGAHPPDTASQPPGE